MLLIDNNIAQLDDQFHGYQAVLSELRETVMRFIDNPNNSESLIGSASAIGY